MTQKRRRETPAMPAFRSSWHRAQEDQTVVLFTHAGRREPVEFMHHCSTKWAVFLLSLKGWIERAEGRRTPTT